jgi:hypothetical protein
VRSRFWVDRRGRVWHALPLVSVGRALGGRSYLSTVLAWHKRRYGAMLPDFEPVRLKAALKGMRAMRQGDEAPRFEAVSAREVAEWVRMYSCSSDVDMVTLCAAVVTGFCGLLRVSEYCVKTGASFTSCTLPVAGDLTWDDDWAAFNVYPRKKRGKVKGKSYTVVVRDGEVLRPASLLKRMVSMRRVRGTWKPGSPLFVVGGRALDEGVLNRFIASACRATGQRIASSHWLRVGGASAALAMGVAPDMIKLLGRWDSMVYSQYCRMSREAAMQLSGRVASSRAARI